MSIYVIFILEGDEECLINQDSDGENAFCDSEHAAQARSKLGPTFLVMLKPKSSLCNVYCV